MSLPFSPANQLSSAKAMFNRSPVSTLMAYPGNHPIPVPVPSGFPFLSTPGALRNSKCFDPPCDKFVLACASNPIALLHLLLSDVNTISTDGTLFNDETSIDNELEAKESCCGVDEPDFFDTNLYGDHV